MGDRAVEALHSILAADNEEQEQFSKATIHAALVDGFEPRNITLLNQRKFQYTLTRIRSNATAFYFGNAKT